MQRISTPSASSDHKFLPGDGGTFRGTQFSAAWCNAVQEEICNLLEDNGVTLDDNNDGQLRTLFHHLIRGKYVAQGHNGVQIGADGLHISTTSGYGIDIDADVGSITVNIEDAAKTVIDELGVTSSSGLFDEFGCKGQFLLGTKGCGFFPVDSGDPSVAGAVYTGNLIVGSSDVGRSLSVFGSLNVSGAETHGGEEFHSGVVHVNGGSILDSATFMGYRSDPSYTSDRVAKPLIFLNGNFDTDYYLQNKDSAGKLRIFANYSGSDKVVIVRLADDTRTSSDSNITVHNSQAIVLLCVGVNNNGYGKYAKVV